MRLTPEDARHRAALADHAALATIRPDGGVDLVPACFALGEGSEAGLVAIPIERVKAKRPGQLQRERNLAAHPEATLLCEHWDPDDWARLWWVRLRVLRIETAPDAARRLEAVLRARYRQYATADFDRLLVFRIVGASGWSAS